MIFETKVWIYDILNRQMRHDTKVWKNYMHMNKWYMRQEAKVWKKLYFKETNETWNKSIKRECCCFLRQIRHDTWHKSN